MPRFDTAAARDKWAMDRLTSMLTSGIKSATDADWSHQKTGNRDTARAWHNLALRLELLHDLVASGLFDRIKAGGPEWDAIKAWREARDTERPETFVDHLDDGTPVTFTANGPNDYTAEIDAECDDPDCTECEADR